MEIIEHGKTYQVYTCPHCRCVFAASEIDGCKSEWYGKDWVECPECRKEIELKEME